MKTIEKNGMKITWTYEGERIHFTISAPTQGWVTIGFNQSTHIKGAYLLMGRVVDNVAEVVEHYTLQPGKYVPIETLGAMPSVDHAKGNQTGKRTEISFSLPIIPGSQYQKSLKAGNEYIMIMAYSQEDDFQHHSIMRTSVEIEL